jgi:hypothetical protein
MRLKTLTLLLCVLAPGCGAGGAAQNANAPRPSPTPGPAQTAAAPSLPRSATCLLISDEEIKAVQGEAPAAAQGTEHLAGALSMSQCFFRLPTFARSINLEVVRGEQGAPAGALKEYWRVRFHPEAVEERERERELKEERERERERELERERAAGQVREGGHGEKEEEEGGGEEEDERPRRVEGLGQEAYLMGGRRTATLYVLKGDAVVRVGVSDPKDTPGRLKKAEALSRAVLKRL